MPESTEMESGNQFERLMACSECHMQAFREDDNLLICTECGCDLISLTLDPKNKCPVGKWSAVD